MKNSMPCSAEIPDTGTTVLSEGLDLAVASTTDGIVHMRGDWPESGGVWEFIPEEARALGAALADHADRALLSALTDAEIADCRHAAQETYRRVVCGIRARRVAADRFARAQITTDVGHRDGTEYVCVPVDAEDDVPSLLRAVADAWESQNTRLMAVPEA